MAVVIEALPPVEAIAAFEARHNDLRGTFSYLDVWQEEHATMFTVAKSAGFDVLTDIYTAFEKALKEGQTPEQFAKRLRPVLEEKGWWGRKPMIDPASGEVVPAQLGSARRLQTIFDANMRVSHAAGAWAGFEANRRTRPYLRYVAMQDDRTRPTHAARHNLVLPIDHPYWNFWATPCGWGCRCTMQSLSQRDIDNMIRDGVELFFEPPEDTWKNFVNRRTGQVTRVPDGIDPGWAYNPGRAGYEARVNQAIADKVAVAPSEFASAAIEERLSSSAFERFVRNPQGSMPVMPVRDEIAAALNIEPGVALLSADTMKSQIQAQPDMTVEDYRLLGSLPSRATLALVDGDTVILLSRLTSGRWLQALLTAGRTNKFAFLSNYRFTEDVQTEALLQKTGISILFDRR